MLSTFAHPFPRCLIVPLGKNLKGVHIVSFPLRTHTHTRTYAHTHTYTKQMRAVSVQWASFYSLSRIQYKIQACCASAVGFCWIDALNFNSALAWPLTPPYGPSGDFAGVDWGAASTLASAPRPGHPQTVPLWCFLFALSM